MKGPGGPAREARSLSRGNINDINGGDDIRQVFCIEASDWRATDGRICAINSRLLQAIWSLYIHFFQAVRTRASHFFLASSKRMDVNSRTGIFASFGVNLGLSQSIGGRVTLVVYRGLCGCGGDINVRSASHASLASAASQLALAVAVLRAAYADVVAAAATA